MKKNHTLILVGFFLTVSVAVSFRIITTPPKSDRLQTAEEETRIKNLYFYTVFWQQMSVAAAGSVIIAGLLIAGSVSLAHLKRAQVHTYKIGESEVIIHERDLSLAAPVAMGLMNAEQLRQMNGGMEKAFELSCRMAEIQSQQIRALIGKHPMPLSLPAVTDHHEEHQPAPIPTFADLLRSGQIGAQQPLLFGFRNGQPRTGNWKDIYSNATGGQSGSGKTTTLLSLIGQSLLHAIGFWIIDFHWPHEESLLSKLGALRESALVMYADKPIDVRMVLENVNDCIDRRLRGNEPSTPIRVLCIDEVLRIVKNCSYTEEIIERIGTEGRKVNVFGLFAAQSWKADKVDTTARDNLTSIFAHYMKPNQAKPLLQDSDKEKLLKHLRRGQMVFCPVMGEPEILDVPYVSPKDMELVNSLVNSQLVDYAVDQPGQHTGLVKAEPVDLVTQVNATLKNEGDFTALVQSTGLDKAYVSRILNRKQSMSKNAEDKFKRWLSNEI